MPWDPVNHQQVNQHVLIESNGTTCTPPGDQTAFLDKVRADREKDPRARDQSEHKMNAKRWLAEKYGPQVRTPRRPSILSMNLGFLDGSID